MPYTPWPIDGCTLAEALARTVDEASSSATNDFRRFLIEGRLVAYGSKNSRDHRPKLISKDDWAEFPEINFTKSTVAEKDRARPSFREIRVFPLLHAPCCVEALADMSVVHVFDTYVLNDPEVAILGHRAVEAAPLFTRVFSNGFCFARGRNEWPLSRHAQPVGAIRTNSAIGILASPDPEVVSTAADALANRYHRLLEIMGSGSLVGRAIRADDGKSEALSQTVWQHGDFWLDAQKGDVFQLSEDCEEPHEFLKKRWIGVALDRPGEKQTPGSSQAKSRHKPSKAITIERPFSAEQIVAAGSFGPALQDLVFHHPRILELRRAARYASQLGGDLLHEDAGLLTHCFGHDEKLLPIKYGSREKHDVALSTEELEDIAPIFQSSVPREFYDLYSALGLHIFWLFEALRRQELKVAAHTIDGGQITINHTIWSNDVFYVLPRTNEIFEAVGAKMIKRWTGVVFEPAVVNVNALVPHQRAMAARMPSSPMSGIQGSIQAAVSNLWPDGNLTGLMVKKRNARIQAWQKSNGLSVASDKSISRFFSPK